MASLLIKLPDLTTISACKLTDGWMRAQHSDLNVVPTNVVSVTRFFDDLDTETSGVVSSRKRLLNERPRLFEYRWDVHKETLSAE